MPLTLTRRGAVWYLRGTVRGQPVYESTKTGDKAAAEALRIKRESELLQDSIFGRRANASFLEAAVSYLEHGGETRFVGVYDEATGRWSGLIGHFGTRKLATIGQIDLDQAAQILLPNATAETRNRQVYTPFIALWRHGAQRDLCEARLWQRPRMRAKPRQRWCPPDEVDLLITHAAPHIKPLVPFLALTGARGAEAFDLDWRDVDLTAAWAVFRDTKNGQDRGVPLHPCLVAILANLAHREGAVFRTARGQPYADRERLAGGQVKTAWAGMCRRAGVEGVTPHTLRHTFATWLVSTGCSTRVRDELMGHKTGDVGYIYAHVPRADLVAAVNRLPSIGAKSAQPNKPESKKQKKIRALG